VPSSISHHSLGLAVELSIAGTRDTMGDGETQFVLIILSDYLHEKRWIWGAAFWWEDSQHFQVSADLVGRWIKEGML
jgi:hypothetical protein